MLHTFKTIEKVRCFDKVKKTVTFYFQRLVSVNLIDKKLVERLKKIKTKQTKLSAAKI